MDVKLIHSESETDTKENDKFAAYRHYDVSFLVALRLKQESRNLKKILAQIDKAKKKSLEMFEYEREQTEIDLEERIKKRSTPLGELHRTKGRKESISISRRESLEVVRAHTKYVWNNAHGLPTYERKSLPAHERKTTGTRNNNRKRTKMTEKV